jgi:hypothetical protein
MLLATEGEPVVHLDLVQPITVSRVSSPAAA